MHIRIERDKLIEGIQTASRAVSPRVVNPILSGIHISVTEGGVTFTGSDTDLSISYHLPLIHNREEEEHPIEVMSEGEVVLLAKIIVDMVKKLPPGMVEIEEKEQGLIYIHSDSVEFNVHGMDPEDYPQIPVFEEQFLFHVDSGALRDMLKQVIIASSTSDVRPILKGMEWTLRDRSISFIATDSHRLAKGVLSVADQQDNEIKIVVPSKNLQELIKLLEEREEELEITLTNTQLLIKADNLIFYSRLLDGKFPDTSAIIPKGGKTSMIVKTDLLRGALERAQLIAQHERNHVVRLTSINEQEFEVYSFFPEIGKFSEVVHDSEVSGEELKITFNVKYLLDALRTIEAPSVELHFNGPISPFIVHPHQSDSILHLIVPVRTN